MKYENRRRTRQVFTLTALEHRGAREGNERLVCFIKGEAGLLAIWGTRNVNMGHIELVEQLGFPLTIECDWIEPDPYEAQHFGHRFWVWQTDYFKVLPQPTDVSANG